MILPNEYVKVTGNAYLGLLSFDGKTRELKRPVSSLLNPKRISSSDQGLVELCIPETFEYYNPKMIVAWWGLLNLTSYKVVIRDMCDTLIWVTLIKKPFIKQDN